jgi:hypothetical protein
MILRVSAAFAKRFKCYLSDQSAKIPEEPRLDAWSCHYVTVRRKPLVIVMNDATLHAFMFPVTGVKDFPDMWRRLLARIAELWSRHGAEFDPNNQSVILLGRTNRQLIGTMNDMVNLIRFYDDRAKINGTELDLEEMEKRSNETPYSMLGYHFPCERIKIMLGRHTEDGE